MTVRPETPNTQTGHAAIFDHVSYMIAGTTIPLKGFSDATNRPNRRVVQKRLWQSMA